ncbi:hypothetical protein K7X08_026442 [Anisodus acutangulus]|uniref:Uncharacterized protein n=1 Tax=Anisodus acutangulus TaxID=402998 RepID=A0A9Q1R2Y3_9SOLA|nr:hypothetical protein K7X08_026442 [Anisodus acutangulus]
MKRSGKQPAVQEKINQLRLQSSDKNSRKRTTPLSSLASVGSFFCIHFLKPFVCCFSWWQIDVIIYVSFKEISNLHATKSKFICCHFNSQGDLLATAGQDRKILIWDLGNDNVNSGEGRAHFVIDIRFRPN